jgi:hypothetical protein
VPLPQLGTDSRSFTAAYQVGLTFLTQHMRRAVAACTSPEVLFRNGFSADPSVAASMPAAPTDVLGLAMENLNIVNAQAGVVASPLSAVHGSLQIE